MATTRTFLPFDKNLGAVTGRAGIGTRRRDVPRLKVGSNVRDVFGSGIPPYVTVAL